MGREVIYVNFGTVKGLIAHDRRMQLCPNSSYKSISEQVWVEQKSNDTGFCTWTGVGVELMAPMIKSNKFILDTINVGEVGATGSFAQKQAIIYIFDQIEYL